MHSFAVGGPLKSYYVYILTNRSKHPFYTGMTNSIERRTWEHKNPDHEDFCARYRVDRLVYFEEFSNVIHAITREKQIKNMHRIDKMKLIVSMNPEWKDLSEGWFERHRYQPDARKCIDPEFATQTQDDKSKG
jgi:putative endonuclease